MTKKNLFMHLRNLIRRRRLKSFRSPEGDTVEMAFTFEGVDYYHYPDATKMPAGRMSQALVVYEEFNMRCTREYLDLHCRAVDELFSNPNLKQPIAMFMQLHNNLKERLTVAMFPEHIYKLASVMFFDKTESRYNYDRAYNQLKIEKWKRAGGALDFFLKGPLLELIPFTSSVNSHLGTFLTVADNLDELHQKDLHQVLSKNP